MTVLIVLQEAYKARVSQLCPSRSTFLQSLALTLIKLGLEQNSAGKWTLTSRVENIYFKTYFLTTTGL